MRYRDRILWFLRAMVISPEFLALTIGFAMFSYRQYFGFLTVLGSNHDIVKWASFVPGGMLLWTLKCWKGIRIPNNPNVKWYQALDGFLSIRIVCFVGVIYSVVSTIGGILLFALELSICPVCIAIGLIVVISVSGSSAFTMYMAEMRLIEHLNQVC